MINLVSQSAIKPRKGLRYYLLMFLFTLFFIIPRLAEEFGSNPIYQKYFQQFFGVLTKSQPVKFFEQESIREFIFANLPLILLTGAITFGVIIFADIICYVFMSLKTRAKQWLSISTKREEEVIEKVLTFEMPLEKMTA